MHDCHTERRQFTRIPFDAQTMMAQGDRQWSVDLIDLSLKGLLINAPEDWQARFNDELIATITLDGDITIKMEVQQRHTEHGHIGFECQHIDIDSISHLRRLVELNLPDTSQLERELIALGH